MPNEPSKSTKRKQGRTKIIHCQNYAELQPINLPPADLQLEFGLHAQLAHC